MKCMNPGCDSKEFSMGSMVSLTDMDNPAYHRVTCDVCGMAGPEGDTEEDAKSYFEEKEIVKSYPGGTLTMTVPSAWAEYVEKIRSLKPLIVEDEMSNDLDSLAYAAWHSERMDQLSIKADIPKEVLEMEFGSEYSASREALKQIDDLRAYERATIAGQRAAAASKKLYEDFIKTKCPDIQIKDGEKAVIKEPSVQYSSDEGNREPITITSQEQANELFGKGTEIARRIGGMIEKQAAAIQNIEFKFSWNWEDSVIERNDPPPVPMGFDELSGSYADLKKLYHGVPFDMSKERREMEQLRYRQSMGFDGGEWPKTPFSDIDIAIANGIPSTEREIKIQKPLTPGPTQITNRPPPEITAPTINMANYTNKCDCGAPAYRGYTEIECTDPTCQHWVKPKP